MIAIVDYGMANLRSVEKALARLGAEAVITSDPAVIDSAERVVLPGVGAFCASMTQLNGRELQAPLRRAIDSGRPFLGICVGLQMLFESSTEMGDTPGLGVFPGKVVRFFERGTPPGAERLKVPHMGWNTLETSPDSALLRNLPAEPCVYFVHSFYPEPADPSIVTARADYGGLFCAAIESGNVAATQFHPEKSGAIGLQILKNFIEWQP